MATQTQKSRGKLHRQQRTIRHDDDTDTDDEIFSTGQPPRPVPIPALRTTAKFTSNVSSEASPSSPHSCSAGADRQSYLSRSRESLQSCSSIVDGLLFEIYDRWQFHQRDSLDSDTFTEYSSTSDAFFGRSDSFQLAEFDQKHSRCLHRAFLESKDKEELKRMRSELQHRSSVASARLVRQLKRKDRRLAKVQKNYDIITAILQAASLKRREDTRIRFSLNPLQGDDAFQQWSDAMKSVARLPLGIPSEFRKTVWLSLADAHICSMSVDWEKTKKFAFNERSNPDDNKLGLQIVKDLHRTGCSGFSGQDNEEDRAVLKRVLLAYARWNKMVGYCQGFNVLAALILEVMDRNEGDALKVMVYLIDHVLPESYFANNLRALSVDMAVFRDLLSLRLPQLSKHLDHLQAAARDHRTGANYEPPLTNVFTMQWFLTLFATCLPKATALRVWDSVMLEGSEILLRTALAIWGKLQNRMLAVQSADEFYTTMGILTQEMLESMFIEPDELIKMIYSMGPFPMPQLAELREKYTYNITPFTAAMSTGRKPAKPGVAGSGGATMLSDDDDMDEEDLMDNIGCFTGMFPAQQMSRSRSLGETDRSQSGSAFDISKASPGAYESNPENIPKLGTSAYMERMTTDIDMLKKQYMKLRQRQKQAHIILTAASAKHNAKSRKKLGVAPIESPVALNHLFLSKRMTNTRRNRAIGQAPQIAPVYPKSGIVGAQLPGPHKPHKESATLASRGSNDSGRHVRHPSGSSVLSTKSDITVSERSFESLTSDMSIPSPESVCSTVDLDSVVESNLDSQVSDVEPEEVVTTVAMDVHNSEQPAATAEEEVRKSDLIDFGDGGPVENLCRNLSEGKNKDPVEIPEEEEETQEEEKHENLADSSADDDLKTVVSKHLTSKCPVVTGVEVSKSTTVIEEEGVKSQGPVKGDISMEELVRSVSLDTNGKDILIDGQKATLLQIADLSKQGKLDLKSISVQGKPGLTADETLARYVAELTFKEKKRQRNPQTSDQQSDSGQLSDRDGTDSDSPIKAPKVFNPFPSRHVNSKRTKNGIKLGLYSPGGMPSMDRKPCSNVKDIGRTQINACLHRQYMAEVKQQAKSGK